MKKRVSLFRRIFPKKVNVEEFKALRLELRRTQIRAAGQGEEIRSLSEEIYKLKCDRYEKERSEK